MSTKKTIAQIAAEYLARNGHDYIDYGDQHHLCEIFDWAGMKRTPGKSHKNHPLNRTKRVLDAIDRNSQSKKPLFKKLRYGSPPTLKGDRMFELIAKSVEVEE